MRIKGFRVRKYRNIEDSGEVTLLDKLTCIVGKNQSGKTALLRALYKFKPYQAEPYDIRREWPRGQRTKQITNQIVCEVSFELEAEEKQKIAELTTKAVSTDKVIITKNYEGAFEIRFPEQPDLVSNSIHPNDIDAACAALAAPSTAVGPTFLEAARDLIAEVKRFAAEGRFSELAELRKQQTERLRENITAGNPEPQHANENKN
jgi:hypothetical protein